MMWMRKGREPMEPKTLPEPQVETRQEARLITLYRGLSEAERQAVLRYFASISKSTESTPQNSRS